MESPYHIDREACQSQNCASIISNFAHTTSKYECDKEAPDLKYGNVTFSKS